MKTKFIFTGVEYINLSYVQKIYVDEDLNSKIKGRYCVFLKLADGSIEKAAIFDGKNADGYAWKCFAKLIKKAKIKIIQDKSQDAA